MKREEFVEEELPRVFHTLDLLEIELDELESLYANYKEKRNEKADE
jgi:hypothetical protein